MSVVGVRTWADNRRRSIAQLEAKFHKVPVDFRFFQRHSHSVLSQWCSATFGHKHYWQGYGAFWFTFERDAVLFRLAWT